MKMNKWIFGFVLFIFFISAYAADDSSIRTIALKGTVALTFDDGPTREFTPQILAILKKYHIKATFFMVGMSAKAHPEVVKMVLADGHQIDSHSLTHAMLTKLNDKQLQKEVAEPQTIINNIIQQKPRCLRYPYGASNEHVRNVIRKNGIIPVSMGWNSFDYDRPGVEKIVNNVLNNAHSGQVFLFHDGFAKREQTVTALPKIIEGLKKKGFGFSTIC